MGEPMTEPGTATGAAARRYDSAEEVAAVLRGGPTDLPATLRDRLARRDQQTIKVVHRGGYEHFERVEGAEAVTPLVFNWVTRTAMAE